MVAFKDPDGSACHQLLTSQQLYILGVSVKVTRWKEKLCHTNKTNPPNTSHDPYVLESWSSTPDVAMTEEPQSLTPTTTSTTCKHQLLTTPTTPKTPSGSKKKWVGSH